MIGEGGGSQHVFVSIAHSASESQMDIHVHVGNKLPAARTSASKKKDNKPKSKKIVQFL